MSGIGAIPAHQPLPVLIPGICALGASCGALASQGLVCIHQPVGSGELLPTAAMLAGVLIAAAAGVLRPHSQKSAVKRTVRRWPRNRFAAHAALLAATFLALWALLVFGKMPGLWQFHQYVRSAILLAQGTLATCMLGDCMLLFRETSAIRVLPLTLALSGMLIAAHLFLGGQAYGLSGLAMTAAAAIGSTVLGRLNEHGGQPARKQQKRLPGGAGIGSPSSSNDWLEGLDLAPGATSDWC